MIINCWKLIYRNNKFLDVILVRYHLYEQTCHSLTRVKDIMRLGTFSISNTDDDWMPLHYNASNAVLKFWLKRSVWETIGQTSQNYSECFCSDTWTVCHVNMMLSYGRITLFGLNPGVITKFSRSRNWHSVIIWVMNTNRGRLALLD